MRYPNHLLRAQAIARIIEEVAVKFDMHVALTGGTLYKVGERKDIDFILYHVRGSTDKQTMKDNVVYELGKEGFSNIQDFGFVTKCTYEGIDIDLLYPECTQESYYDLEDTDDLIIELNDRAFTPFSIPGLL